MNWRRCAAVVHGVLFGAALLAGCTGGSHEPPSDARWTVTADAFGPIRFGMSVEEAAAVLGEEVVPAGALLPEGCGHARPVSLPPGTALMVVGDHVARVEVDSAGVRTARGAEVGMPEEEVRRLYGAEMRTEPHEYTSGQYLLYLPEDSAGTSFGIVFETEEGRVARYRAGRRPEVLWVEGCA